MFISILFVMKMLRLTKKHQNIAIDHSFSCETRL